MSISSVLIVSVLSLILVKWLWSRRRFYRNYMKLPGPLGLPLIGLGFQIIKPENFITCMYSISKKYKTPYITWMGPNCYLCVNDPETLEVIFQSPACINKGDLYFVISDVIGDNVLTSKTPRWTKHRRLLNPAFGRKTVETFMPVFNKEANVLLNILLESKNQSVDAHELFTKAVLEVACRNLMKLCTKRILSPWLYSDVIYRQTADWKSQKKSAGTVIKFIENLLRSRINSSKTLAENSNNSHNIEREVGVAEPEVIGRRTSKIFIERVLSYIQSGQLTFQEVVNEANIIMGAAFETTSITLYLVCLCLAMHPEHQEKLFNELVGLFPANDKEMDVTLEHLEQMTYTQMVINETMRLFAPGPIVVRRASADFNLRKGIVIPEGTQIFIDIFNIHRNEEVWGPHARSFDPDRHFGNNFQRHPYAFIPFAKGMRMCIGYRYAEIMMKTIIAKIFRNYRVMTEAKIEDLSFIGAISLQLSHHPTCKFQLREVVLSTPEAGQNF